MQATAHPDDENNALHVYLNRGQGVRTILATATRGDGGQNEIGPEIFDALAVLRTEELDAMHRFDATRAVLHSRGRLRLFVQHRRDAREMGARRNYRRLCAPDSHDAP